MHCEINMINFSISEESAVIFVIGAYNLGGACFSTQQSHGCCRGMSIKHKRITAVLTANGLHTDNFIRYTYLVSILLEVIASLSHP